MYGFVFEMSSGFHGNFFDLLRDFSDDSDDNDNGVRNDVM